ncbi:MAG: DUF4830 domain-containing protein [Oscillospiraceae bacterium]|nr:DUF4830 domain-containing protein [Oscillospiraceae bacterium]
MLVMTAKVDFKKILLILAAIAAVLLALIGMLDTETPTAAPVKSTAISGNDARVKFLQDLGWEVTTSPAESGPVRIPEETSQVFDRYNQLQKSQGYDLSAYAGKKVMRYVYQVNNYPGATAPVYATLLIYKDTVIGGDITDTAAGGHIRALKTPSAIAPPMQTGAEGSTTAD